MTLAVLLGLGAAIGYGIGDFLAGIYCRRHGTLIVLVICAVGGLLAVLLAIHWMVPSTVALSDLAWGALFGIAGFCGGGLLYQGFRVGRLSVVTPISSLAGAGIPLIVDLLLDVALTLPALLGMLMGLAAIWLISTGTPETRNGKRSLAAGLGYGLGAGVGFAMAFLAISQADPASGAWPVLAGQASLFIAAVAFVLALGLKPSVPLSALPGIMAIGALGGLGTISFLFAAHIGLVSVAAVIASLSPGVTVILARCFLAELLPWRQIAGLLIALAALALISLG